MSSFLPRVAVLFATVLLTAWASFSLANAQPKPDTSRIVSIGSDATEILYALGLASRIVAVDTTSLYPPEALKEKQSVGYMRALSTEGVLSTGPTLIVANALAGPPEVMRALKQSRVPVIALPANDRPEAVASKIRLLADALGLPEKGAVLAAGVEAGFRNVAAARARIGKPVRAVFILGVTAGRATVGGNGTTADTMLALAGAVNAAAAIPGYKPLGDEALIALAPDVIVTTRRMTDDPVASHIRQLPAFAATPAGKANRIVEMDAVELLGFGPRAPAAALSLLRALHPEVVAR